MKFSVIIPLYNKAPYIRKALESVLVQTYTDYELIIVDDGSTDGSAEIAEAILQEATRLQGYEAKDQKNSGADTLASRLSPLTSNLTSDSAPASRLSPLAFRLRLLKQPNQGVSAARNTGVTASTGDYVALLDADDWWEPTYLERMARLIEDYPDAGLYASNYVYYKPGKTHVALNIPTGYINYPKAYYDSNAMPVWTGAAIIPRKVYDEMGGFPMEIKLGEDFLLWSKIALRYPVAFLNEALAWYNNDVPATLRATRNLHAPEHHMLFRLELAFGDEAMRLSGYQAIRRGEYEYKAEGGKCKGVRDKAKGERLEVKGAENSGADIPAFTPYTLHLTPTKADWKSLLDKLRINGLLEYWLDKRYHDLAAEELKKVDWTQQPDSVKRIYKTPIWMLKVKQRVMQVGSFVKQKMIKMLIIR